MTTSPVMTVTDELLAELAQELNRCKFSDDDDGDESWPSISGEAVSALTAELRRLRAENAELAKDAGRLEELAKQANVNCRNTAYYLRKHRPDMATICSGWCDEIDTAMAIN